MPTGASRFAWRTKCSPSKTSITPWSLRKTQAGRPATHSITSSTHCGTAASAVNETLGLRPRRPWLHRLKYGVSFHLPDHTQRPPSATFVSGPLGEVVTYQDGLIYLTWYPVCLLSISNDVAPPEWPTHPTSRSIRTSTRHAGSNGQIRLVAARAGPGTIARRHREGRNMWPGAKPTSTIATANYTGATRLASPQTANSIPSIPEVDATAPYFAQLCADRILESRPSMSNPQVTVGVPVFRGQINCRYCWSG